MLNNLAYWLMVILAVLGVVALFVIATRQLGVKVPQWAIQMFWVLVVVVCGILGIKFVIGLI